MGLSLAISLPSAFSAGGRVFSVNIVQSRTANRVTVAHDPRAFVLTDLSQFRRDLVALLPRLRRFALTLTRNRDDGDDLVQAACERAIQRAAQWQAGTRLDSWLFTMMRNIWVSEMRSRKVRLGRGHVDATEADELSTPVAAPDHLYANQLIAMVMSLPEGLSSCLLLVSVEGHSYQDAAGILDIPIGTVMSRMSRARVMMKELLDKAAAMPGGVAVR